MQDHLRGLQTVYDERFAHEYGPWRPVVAQVADKFLACGVLIAFVDIVHGSAAISCMGTDAPLAFLAVDISNLHFPKKGPAQEYKKKYPDQFRYDYAVSREQKNAKGYLLIFGKVQGTILGEC